MKDFLADNVDIFGNNILLKRIPPHKMKMLRKIFKENPEVTIYIGDEFILIAESDLVEELIKEGMGDSDDSFEEENEIQRLPPSSSEGMYN